MAKKRRNFLLEKITRAITDEPRGRMLDLGCGNGDYAKTARDLGFETTACDIDRARFDYHNEVKFVPADISKRLPFDDASFDLVLFLEVIEHLHNPYYVLSEISRIIRKDGCLFISTPNILNLKSRMRFLFEGTFDFFREPPLDQLTNPKEKGTNIHLFLYRIHELEYALFKNGLKVERVFTSVHEAQARSCFFLIPIIKLQSFLKCRRSLKKAGVDFRRLHDIMLSGDMLFGRHLILKVVKL